jgi:Glycosyl hydrolase family 71
MTLPFVMPPIDTFFNSPKRVIAHYFWPFPLSIDNVPPPNDYIGTQFMTVNGENSKHAAYGGYIRRRPLPAPTGTPTPGYQIANMQTEVKAAMARGITGFEVDILDLTDPQLGWMFTAAAAVDPRFWVVPMPDMSSLGAATTVAQMVTLLASCSIQPNVARLPDGRMFFTAFNATLMPITFWQQTIAGLNAKGIPVAFVPVLLGEPASDPYAAIAHGVGGWGTANVQAASTCPPAFMMPVLPQQFRPDAQIFWEAGNTGSLRAGFMAAINAAICQMIQLVTWNDFSESGQVSPCTNAVLTPNIGTGFYDLLAYYITWFVTGVQPPITQDVAYWCYKSMLSSAAHANQALPIKIVAPGIETANIELLAFLTAPATLMINGVGTLAPAGVTSFTQPMAPGFPQFNVQRDGSDVFEFKGPMPIYGPAGSPAQITDLTYSSGSCSKAGMA